MTDLEQAANLAATLLDLHASTLEEVYGDGAGYNHREAAENLRKAVKEQLCPQQQ